MFEPKERKVVIGFAIAIFVLVVGIIVLTRFPTTAKRTEQHVYDLAYKAFQEQFAPTLTLGIDPRAVPRPIAGSSKTKESWSITKQDSPGWYYVKGPYGFQCEVNTKAGIANTIFGD